MAELLITAAWLVTLWIVLYWGLREIARLFDDDGRGRRRSSGGDPMYFDVSRVEREALAGARVRRRADRR